MNEKEKPALPGRRRDTTVQEIIRVDHAGEYGAVRIYQGQLTVFKHLPHKHETMQLLSHMAKQEQAHLVHFNTLVNEHKVRPTAFAPIWHVAGFALGATTALIGERAAYACTVAIEEVIDEHYRSQIDRLDEMGGQESELRQTLESFRKEEVQHRDEALTKGAAETPGYALLSGAIKAACRIAIKLSEKV